ncbi:MAG TPA: PaaI family thioesterase [Bacteroidales bacterium]|nr:PaaI family thioesterase [Bacteroidales bacterium]HSA44706.1 PaaI family thioesterase [Bacteroidales bacterium]
MNIRNPYRGGEGYHCFGCCPDNADGLQMTFRKEGEKVICDWLPLPQFQGWTKVLHGGIQATLMDEAGSWFALLYARSSGVTTRLNVTYRRPVPTDQGAIRLEVSFREMHGRLLTVDVRLFGPSGQLCSEALATYFMFDEKTSRERFHYPGDEAFYRQDE